MSLLQATLRRAIVAMLFATLSMPGPESAIAANKKPKVDSTIPIPKGENPFSLRFFPGAGMRNTGESTSTRSRAEPQLMTRGGGADLSGMATMPGRQFRAQAADRPIVSCKGLARTEPDVVLSKLGACEADARAQIRGLVDTGCISKIKIKNGDTLTFEYRNASRPPNLKKKRRTGYQGSGTASFQCIPWGEAPGVRLIHRASSSSFKGWDFTVVRVGGNVVIDKGQFSSRFESSIDSGGTSLSREAIITFHPREVRANPYDEACSPQKGECGVWRRVDIAWEGGKRVPPDPNWDVPQETFLGFENKATIAYKYRSRGALEPLQNVLWFLQNSFNAERYGEWLSAEVLGNGPRACDWKESDHPRGQGYEDPRLRPFVEELHAVLPELPPILPIDYDLSIRERSCALCNAQGSCSSEEWNDPD